MHILLDELLGAAPAAPSALDVDATRLHVPLPPEPAPVAPVRRLSAFDVADEEAEARRYVRLRLIGATVASVAAALVAAGSVAVGF